MITLARKPVISEKGVYRNGNSIMELCRFPFEFFRRVFFIENLDNFYKFLSVFDIIEMENDERDDLLKMDEGQMTDVAKFCNRYPNIEMNHEVVDPEDAQTGSPTIVNVTLEREDELQGNVIGKFFLI